jgi:hypothetical protein
LGAHCASKIRAFAAHEMVDTGRGATIFGFSLNLYCNNAFQYRIRNKQAHYRCVAFTNVAVLYWR